MHIFLTLALPDAALARLIRLLTETRSRNFGGGVMERRVLVWQAEQKITVEEFAGCLTVPSRTTKIATRALISAGV